MPSAFALFVNKFHPCGKLGKLVQNMAFLKNIPYPAGEIFCTSEKDQICPLIDAVEFGSCGQDSVSRL